MNQKDGFQAREFRKRLIGVLVFRVIAISTLLGVTFLRGLIRGDYGANSEKLIIAFIVAIYLASIIYALLLRFWKELMAQAVLQLVFDYMLVTVICYFSGGNDSLFTVLYPIFVIISAILLYWAGAFIAATAGTVAIIVLALDQQLHFLPDMGYSFGQFQQFDRDVSQTLYVSFVNIFAMFMIASLASYLSNQIRMKGLLLEEKHATLLDLTALHEAIVRSIPSGVVTCDRVGRVTFANRTACAILNRDEDGVVGVPLTEMMPGLYQAPEGDFETIVAARGGLNKVLSCQYAQLHDYQGNSVGSLVVFQDVSMLHEMEETVRRSEKLAAIGRVAAGLAHEIRNPLAAITGSVELLAGAKGGSEDMGVLMRIVSDEAERLNSLIEKFLMYARPVNPHFEEIDLSTLISDTIKVFRNDPDLGPEVEVLEELEPGLRVVVDPAQIKQVVWNLLRNAAQAVREKGRVSIELKGSNAPMEVAVLRIVDNGIGIKTESLPHVFDPFFTTKARGTGLGLSIAEAVINAHGGSIQVESAPGIGSTFTVVFRKKALST
jgi:two-component system sensor histidine kinase PilS (NtrC family)